MPLAAIGIGLGTALAGGAAAGATVYGAKKASSANTDAANIAAKSAKESNDAQLQSNDDTLAFQRQQAQNDYRNQEITRHANYDQYSAGQNRMKFLDNAVGLPERQVPSYAPSIDPNFSGTPSAGQVFSRSSGGDASVPAPPKDLKAALSSANQIAYGGSQKHADPAYWTALWQKDPEYAWKRMLGWQAGGSDAPTTGPYAGQSSGAPATHKPMAAPYSAATYLQQRQNPLPTSLSGY